ncbi:hypothetical protein [Massilia oculi]|uniref:hypothetical protein n=1 Tax=Massilia oculi TaxID=945844 RepID=UPI0028AFB9DC|nr:hypothetical protein [Massilia oculi]
MSYDQARRWLALYFLILTAALGAYILIAAGTVALPISRQDGNDAFKIIIPVLCGQLTVMFQWLSHIETPDDRPCPIPVWAIKAPPMICLAILAVAVAVLVAGNPLESSNVGLSTADFKGVLTFIISLLNCSTVYLVARLFGKKS